MNEHELLRELRTRLVSEIEIAQQKIKSIDEILGAQISPDKTVKKKRAPWGSKKNSSVSEEKIEEEESQSPGDVENEDAKKALKYLETVGRGVKANEFIEKCYHLKDGGGSRDKIAKASKAMLAVELIRKDTSGTMFSMLRERIKFYMGVHAATEQDIDQVFNHILAEMI